MFNTNSHYAELHCKTNFSFLHGASHGEELAARAAALDYAALAITDENSLAGVVRAHVAAKAANLKLIIGAEITPDDAARVLVYAPNRKAYGRLSRLITQGRRAAEKGSCLLHFNDIADHADELFAAVVLPSRADVDNTWRAGSVSDRRSPQQTGDFSGRLRSRLAEDEEDILARYRDVFHDRCYLAASLHHGPDDERELERYVQLSRRAKLPLLATNDVHYHDPSRRPLHDVLTAIRHGITVAELGALRFCNGERYLKAPAQMAELFARYPKAIAQTLELAERCHFSLDELRYEYPEELCPPGLAPTDYLAQLTWAGAKDRYPQGIPEKVVALLERELSLIAELQYEAFFLTVWDLVTFARKKSILCQGRGSAANSAVCYCLGITSVDPDRTDVLFERFVSRERNEPPDIDVDFEHERREEVLQYVYRKYGRERAGIVAEVICYRPRSAVRDVGKALGLSLDCVDRFAKTVDHYGESDNLATRAQEAGLNPNTHGVAQLIHFVSDLLSFPRHLSQHVGGFVITQGLLSELVPIENAAMPDRTFIEWDKDDIEALGMLKVDCLALGMLTAIHKCFDLIERHYHVALTLATVSAEDSAVYEMICKADTVGVFQIESRAQMSMLPRLRPRCFYDLVVEVAIVRPGPIQGGMVHPYLRRRNGEEAVTYPSPAIERVLGKTMGVPIFQEQVMRLAIVAAGFTPGEADQLRRAMGAWKRNGVIDKFRDKLREGLLANGLPSTFADQLYEQIKGFGEYGFPESHAASFALLAYVSAWLKCHYPAAFTAALLNSQPMGFYAPAQLVRDAQAHGVTALPVDVNLSEWDCTLEPRASERKRDALPLRLGFRIIRGLSQRFVDAIMEARKEGPFRSVAEFAHRTQLGRPVLARLASADAFTSMGLSRREAFWQVLSIGKELPLFAGMELEEHRAQTRPGSPLPEMSLGQQIVADYDSTGLSLKAHPLSLVRSELSGRAVSTAAEIAEKPHRASVHVAGLVLVRQRPGTAKGTVFITLEDESGVTNLIVWPRVWQRYRHIANGAVALLAHGQVERTAGVLHVVVNRLEDLSDFLTGIAARSRDFR